MALSVSHVVGDTSEPVLDSTVGDALRQAADAAADRLALVQGVPDAGARRRWTFAELREDAERVARALLGRFEPGEHVAVWAPNLPEWVLLQLGAGLAGLVLVPLNPAYRLRELRYALRQSKAAGIVFAPEFRGSPLGDRVAEARKDARALRVPIPFTEWEEFCASGSPRQRLPEVSPLDAAQIQYTSGTTGAPKGAVLHHRGITNNGRFVARGLGVEEGAVLGVEFSVLFGQTEASCTITKTRPGDAPEDKAETVGLPLPRTEVRIVHPGTGTVVEPGTVGEICTRGYAVMHGYHEMPEATAAAIDAECWLHTGDLGVMDSRGYCRIVGRIKDMIIRGGENIYPREIEEVLFTHPAVGDVAVVGIPDERWGEQVAAFVRLAPGEQASEADLHRFVREHLAPHKTPREWIFVYELPLTASGKVQKFVLRDRLLEARRGR